MDYDDSDEIGGEEDATLFSIPVTYSDNDDNEILDEQLGYAINEDKGVKAKGGAKASGKSRRKKKQTQAKPNGGYQHNDDYYYDNSKPLGKRNEKRKGNGTSLPNGQGHEQRTGKYSDNGYSNDYNPNRKYENDQYSKGNYNQNQYKNNYYNDYKSYKQDYYNDDDCYYNEGTNGQGNYNSNRNKHTDGNKPYNHHKKKTHCNYNNNGDHQKRQGNTVEIEVELTDPPKKNEQNQTEEEFNLKAEAFIPKSFKNN